MISCRPPCFSISGIFCCAGLPHSTNVMTDELPKVPYTIRLSRATLANIRANVALSIGLKAAFVILAVAGLATLWMAVLADTGASALVVANAVRLRKFA